MILRFIPFFLAAGVNILLAVLFASSVKKTLYSFRNILLSGCLIFSLVLMVVTARWGFAGKEELGILFMHFPRRFSYYAVCVISAISVLLLVSNVALIRHEGLHLHNVLSIVLAVFYLGGSAAVYIVTDLLENKMGHIPEFQGTVSLFLVMLLCYFECILAGAVIMGYAASRQKPHYDKDYIIILGCSIDKRGGLLPLLKGRVNRAVKFAWEQEIASGKPLRYVPSGGQGPGEIISEGTAMEFYLLSHGAEENEVFPEKQSRSTYENMVFSKKVIDALQPGAKIAFATTNYHMLRSGILAKMAGIDAEGIAAGTKWYFWPNGFIREYIAILFMTKKYHLCAAAVILGLCILVGVIL